MYAWAFGSQVLLKILSRRPEVKRAIVTEPIEPATMASDDGRFRAIANTEED